MKVAILGAVSFAFLLVAGMGLPVGVPEPLRIMLWGLALLSVSAGAKSWISHAEATRELDARGEPLHIGQTHLMTREASRMRKSAVELLAESRG